MVEMIAKIGEFFYKIFKSIQDSIDPEGKGGVPFLIALAVLLPVLLIFVFKKQLMKPVIRYRRKRATRRTYRRRKK